MSARARRGPWYRRRWVLLIPAIVSAVVLVYISSLRARPNAQPPRLVAGAPPVLTARAPITSEAGQDAARPEAPGAPAGSGRAGVSRRAPGRSANPQPAPPPPRMDAPKDLQLLARAIEYQRVGEVDKAIVEYRAALQANEASAQAHNNLGLLYEGKGLIEDAAREFRRALEIEPGYQRARNNLGVAFLHAGSVDAAAAEFGRVLAAAPANQEAMINLALSQRAAGRPGQARETLIGALAIDDRSAVAHYNLALICDDAGESGRALEHYEAYLKYAGADDPKRRDSVRTRCDALRRLLRF